MIDKKKKVCFKMKPKLINTVKNQFIPWYFKAFNKKIAFYPSGRKRDHPVHLGDRDKPDAFSIFISL